MRVKPSIRKLIARDNTSGGMIDIMPNIQYVTYNETLISIIQAASDIFVTGHYYAVLGEFDGEIYS